MAKYTDLTHPQLVKPCSCLFAVEGLNCKNIYPWYKWELRSSSNTCYFFSNTTKTFNQAKAACESHSGAKLTSVQTFSEHLFITGHLLDLGGELNSHCFFIFFQLKIIY